MRVRTCAGMAVRPTGRPRTRAEPLVRPHARLSAFIADRANDAGWGLEVVGLAENLESRLNPVSLQPPRLRFYKAVFLEKSGQPSSAVLEVLLEGARMWCDRLPGPLGIRDYQQAVGGMHDHFRKLSVMLLREGRNEEAFLAFEIGRARTFAVEVNGDHAHPLVSTNPFAQGTIDCSLLKRMQAGLGQDHLVVFLAILPPHLVAFIVGRDSLQVCQRELAKDLTEANAFGEAVRTMSSALELGKGVNCMPEQIATLARELADRIGNRSIVLLAPHEWLHKVPWRAAAPRQRDQQDGGAAGNW